MKTERYIKGSNIRSTRIPIEYSVTYTMGNISGEGFITDISKGEVTIRIKQALVIGDELYIKIKISNELIVELTGEVRKINGNIARIKIKTIDPDVRERFINHIDGMLRLKNMKEGKQ